jgi:methylthioribulose-1-phosphate dehydratase
MTLTADYAREGGRVLAEAARDLYQRGWMEGTAGNLSLRVPDGGDHALITASGRSKGRLSPVDAVEVRLSDGQPVDPGGLRASAETPIHAALLRLFDDCGAVAHAHPPYSTVVASAAVRGKPPATYTLQFSDFEIIKGLGVADPTRITVPVFANWPDVPRIAQDIEDYFRCASPGFPEVLLIAHHGATAWGPTLEIARNRLECLEAACKLSHLSAYRNEGQP